MREIQEYFAPLPGILSFESDPLELFAQLRFRLVNDGVTVLHLDGLQKPHTNAKWVQHHQPRRIGKGWAKPRAQPVAAFES